MALAYLSFGSNLDNPRANIEKALELIREKKLGDVLRSSKWYKTAPLDCEGGDFINHAVELMTDRGPEALLAELQTVEEEMGRTPEQSKTGARVIDIDILLFDSNIIDTENLTIPHPKIADRLFILKCLQDIKPNLLHPVEKKPVSEIAEQAPKAVRDQKVAEA